MNKQDNRNNFTNDRDIKWVIAQRLNGCDWKVLFLSFSETCPNLGDDNKPYFDDISQEDFNNSEFAVFKNRTDWWLKKPYRLADYRQNKPIPRSIGMWLINQADASYF